MRSRPTTIAVVSHGYNSINAYHVQTKRTVWPMCSQLCMPYFPLTTAFRADKQINFDSENIKGTKYLRLLDRPPDQKIPSCTSGPKVMYTKLGTVGLGPQWLLHH
ncbi:hypothetical protein TNCV_3279421 [Trichonephila clavipes]|nr:hypothetical protein TNCV_3279421 [Trichonephila clavipes]